MSGTSMDAVDVKLLMTDGEDVIEDTCEHLAGETDRIDIGEKCGGVEVEHGCRFGPVDFEAVPDDRFVGVVGPSLLPGSIQDPLHQRFVIAAGEVQDQSDIDIPGDHLALGGIPRDAVQQQDLPSGVERAVGDPGGELLAAQRDGEVVGDEVSAGGVFGDRLCVGRGGVEAAEDLSTGEMKEAGESAQDGALCPFSAAGGAEEQDGGGSGVCHRVGPIGQSR